MFQWLCMYEEESAFYYFFFFQAEDGIRDFHVTGVQTCALPIFVAVSNGDARVALNALELASDATAPGADGRRTIGLAEIREALQRRSLLYDRAGDQHYDTISAFIKSVPGADPMFIARRIVILAGEDIGLADPQALVIASAAQQATHLIGFPEGYFPLAEATVYLALAPKSDSLKRGLGELQHDLAETRV